MENCDGSKTYSGQNERSHYFSSRQAKKNIHAPSRSDAIRRAIELSDTLTTAIKHGDKIVIEGKSGKKQIIIPGLEEE